MFRIKFIKLYKLTLFLSSNTAKLKVFLAIRLNYGLNHIMRNQLVFLPPIKYIFVNIPGTTSEQNNGNQNEDEISQPNLEDQASTSKNKSE